MPVFEASIDLFDLVELLGFEYGMREDGTLGVWPIEISIPDESDVSVKLAYINQHPDSLLAVLGPNTGSTGRRPSQAGIPKKVLTREMKKNLEKALRMRKSGKSLKTIAKKFSVSHGCLSRILRGLIPPYALHKRPL